MAIELGKVNVADLAVNDYKVIGIGIDRSSNSNGIFSVNFTTLSQTRDNLKNLIMTRKGERVMYPEFGCDIWSLLFEPIINGSNIAFNSSCGTKHTNLSASKFKIFFKEDL